MPNTAAVIYAAASELAAQGIPESVATKYLEKEARELEKETKDKNKDERTN